MLWVYAALLAVPGPDSVIVVASRLDLPSVALAERYAAARQLPDQQVCLIDAPLVEDVDFDTFKSAIVGGIAACTATYEDRIEAIVLARGLPLRVGIPGGGRVSMAAALALGETTTATGAPVLGRRFNNRVNCGGGNMCDAAMWSNPYRSGVFGPDWTATTGQAIWHPKIVTMLHGRTYADAAKLVASATTAEAIGGARGTFTLMSGADPARGALDFQYGRVVTALRNLGFTDVEQVPFDANRTGHTYAAFFTGTAGIGASIEGNTFAPGAIVDNLTSYGAVAENFRDMGESQVSIARWVAKGVAGVHGTTDEPLNNCFPQRDLLVSYASGGTLGEAYFRAMPFVYWHNLVLGDPMAAPYAHRPRVTIGGVADGETIDGSRQITVTATVPLEKLTLYVDGVEVASTGGNPIDVCAAIRAAPGQQILAVAQGTTEHHPKGWAAIRVTGRAGPSDCTMIEPPDAGVIGEPDASAPDASANDASANDASASADDAAVAPPLEPEGCTTAGGGSPWMSALSLIAWSRRRPTRAGRGSSPRPPGAG